MYVRAKRVKRAGKVHGPYWQLVQNTWVEGKTRQTVVAHLGPLPNKEAAFICAKMKGLMCGETDCGREWVETREAVFGRKRKPQPIRLCEGHAREFAASGGITGVAYDPDRAQAMSEGNMARRERLLAFERRQTRQKRERLQEESIFPGREPVLPGA